MTTSIDASTGNLQERLVHTRAIEATIWGMPAVSMAAFRASLPRDLGATYGDILYFSDVLQPRHEALTGNNQTPYVFVIFDLQAGAMVLEVPPAHPEVIFMGSAIDSWQVPLVDIGAAGEDAGIGGKYLFLPPGYSETPPDGYIVVPSETYYIHIALRPIATSKGTLADAVAYSQLLKSYPLTEASNPPANRYIDVFPHDLHTLPTYDVSFLRLLADTIEHEPVQEKDAVMMGMLKSIGIEKGKPFAPDAEQSARMTKAVEDARAIMADYLMNQATIPFWEGRQWMANKPENTFGYSYFGDGILDYDRRSGGFSYYATWAPKRLGEPGKIPASYYLKDFRDKTGNLFKGNSTYRLRVQNDVPTRDFWSVVVYGVETNAFIYNDQERVGLSSYDMSSMAVNVDGSVDIYVGPQAPRGLDSNWIPTAGKDFWLMFRFYGPQRELFEKVWRLNDVEEVL